MTHESSTPNASPRKRLSLVKIAIIAGMVVGGLLAIALVIVLIKRDDILNGYVKDRLQKGVAQSQEGNVLKLSDLHYQIWQSAIICDSGSMTMRDSATRIYYDLRIKGMRYSFLGNRMECNTVAYFTSDSSSACTIDTVFIDGIAPHRLIDGEGVAAMLLAEVRIRLCGVALQQPKANTSLTCARMWISPSDSQLSAEQLTESDSSRQCSMGAVSLHGVNWTKLFGPNPMIPTVCATSILDANNIVILYPGSQYEFQCGRTHISFPASEMSADTVTIQPVDGDAKFFADSKWRKTRIRFDAPRCSMEGADLCGLLQGSVYAARLVQIQDATIEILINKEKPFNTRDPHPRMPDQILAQEKTPVRFDSVQLVNGTLLYQERFTSGAAPAKLVIDGMDVMINGFGNHQKPADTAKVTVQARLQGYQVSALMSVPLAGSGLSAHYSGSMSGADLKFINSWIETEDAMRVKSGTMQGASFNIDVVRGKAHGTLRAVYKDLFVALINARTKSSGGIFDVIKSFIANTFKLRTSNAPDKNGKMKIATVNYTHKADEPFFQFLWFSLRSGLKDLIGF